MPQWRLMMIVAASGLIQRDEEHGVHHSGRSSACAPAYPGAERMAICPLKATVKAISQVRAP